ncbi:MAG TPA: HK97 family phage prohead protease [Bauldia sp.]|nr:HK97 family phage prohead protease [Bauldia sp.]
MKHETKFARVALSSVDADGTFTGYASLFGKTDLGRDVVMPGAFRASLAKRGAGGVKMLFQHDPNQPIGVWTDIREDSQGLFVKGRLTADVARAREVLALMRAGALDGLSIGYRTVRGKTDAKTGVRRLMEVDLWEISVVTFPMQPEARVSSVKALQLAALIRRATAMLRDATR